MAKIAPSFRTPMSIAAEADPYGDRTQYHTDLLDAANATRSNPGLTEPVRIQLTEPERIQLGLIARTLQAETDRDHMLERLRDLATMARDDTDPYLELEVFRLQAEINAPLLKPQ